jgi:hemoglobin
MIVYRLTDLPPRPDSDRELPAAIISPGKADQFSGRFASRDRRIARLLLCWISQSNTFVRHRDGREPKKANNKNRQGHEITNRNSVSITVALTLPLQADPKTEKSLYERLGGVFAIAAVVDHVSDAVVENPIVGKTSQNPALREWHTKNLDRLPGLKFMRTLWVCEVTGGPFKFSATKPGKTHLGLEEAHRDLKITPEEFDEVAAELGRSLDFAKVPEREKGEVLAAFAAHKKEVTAGSMQKWLPETPNHAMQRPRRDAQFATRLRDVIQTHEHKGAFKRVGDVFTRPTSHFPLKPISNVSAFIERSRRSQAD